MSNAPDADYQRKQLEIEHSRKRRSILKGFERLADTHSSSQVNNLESLISSKEDYEYHFSNMKFYSITGLSERYKQSWLHQRCTSDTRVLDFACGNGENSIYVAQLGSKVDAIDISPEGISNARDLSSSLGLQQLCTFHVMDGENMTFPNNTFDIAVEYGALHHVELDTALKELSRVLKPAGEMICIEALRHNPLIHAYRKRTPHLRTQWEVDHILGVESLAIIKKYFSSVNVRFFHLTSLALVPFRKTPLFPVLLPIFNAFDKILLSIPSIGKYGWIMAIELSCPIK